ncbi:MAG: hypothetical protein VCC99_14695 [Alphaproteobacteria bacterium]
MLIWTPADGRRGTPDFETDALSGGFAESPRSETPDETPLRPHLRRRLHGRAWRG